MDPDAYLRRINYSGPLHPSAESLAALHLAHLQAVPFENLDIHLNCPIELRIEPLYEKIVSRRRGGFCYELNGLFAALLVALGFEVELLSARVVDGGQPGPEFDHLTLQVRIPSTKKGAGEEVVSYLADVGFGESFRCPLQLVPEIVQEQPWGVYCLTQEDQTWTYWSKNEQSGWERQYLFTLQPRRFSDFMAMCRFHQTSPESSFTRRRVCSLATPRGRVTLSDRRLILTDEGQREERDLAGEAEYLALLQEWFGVSLPAAPDGL
jgi:N-hydroxyarylamine O-acetyltransferase